MKYVSFNTDTREITLTTNVDEIQDLIMYLGHGRHAKALEFLNYVNLGWKESAEKCKKQRDNIELKMHQFNDILLEIGSTLK